MRVVSIVISNLDTVSIRISGLRHKTEKQSLLIFYIKQWLAGWKMICDVKLSVSWLCVIYRRSHTASDYILNGILLIKDILEHSLQCQILNITRSRWATFATFITPPIPLFSDPVCFPFHPLNVPPPDSPQWHHPSGPYSFIHTGCKQ